MTTTFYALDFFATLTGDYWCRVREAVSGRLIRTYGPADTTEGIESMVAEDYPGEMGVSK